MPTLYTSIGPWTFPTFNLVLTLAVLVSAGIGLRRTSHPAQVADAYLGALIGAVAGARLFHVLLNWNYFAENLNEATMIALGGLDWHGAVIGGLIGLYGAWWLRRFISERSAGRITTVSYKFVEILDSLTPAMPLIGLAGWWGCLATACGYGAEVDNLSNYPAFAVSETGDVYGIAVPRYNTQLFGLILSVAVLIVVIVLFWRGKSSAIPTPQPPPYQRYSLRSLFVERGRIQWRFWLTLALLSGGMFVIGFFRGDSSIYIANLRGDQILDALFVLCSLIAISFQRLAKE